MSIRVYVILILDVKIILGASSYYDVFKNLGLEDDNIKFLNEQSLTDAEVIEYIEKTTKKSYNKIRIHGFLGYISPS